MEIKIGLPDEDGLQKYRMFFEKTENLKTKTVIIKYDEWLQSKSGKTFDLNTLQFVIENIPDTFYNEGEVKEPEVINEEGFLVEKATFHDGTEIKEKGSNAYDEYSKITNTEQANELINNILQNI